MLSARSAVAVALVAAVLQACGGKEPAAPALPAVASVSVTPAADTLVSIGQTLQLSATARDAAGNPISGKSFTWQSSASGVVSVNPTTGLVTGLANGLANISAAVDGKTGQAAIAVEQQVATVVVTPDTGLVAALGATRQFAAVATDANNTTVANAVFIWLSSNHAVATISTSGLATAVGPGAAAITAAARGIPGTASLTVTQTATQLAFTVEPTNTTIERAISPVVQVEIRDASGARVAGARTAVTLKLAVNPTSTTLGGSLTANAVDGIASFSGLLIGKYATGYKLAASASGLTPDTSAAFDVTLGVQQLAEGAACGLIESGRAFCWGRNSQGRLGNGNTNPPTAPTEVAGGLSFRALSNGFDHSCGIALGDAGYCWGLGEYGRLGDGDLSIHSVTVPGSVLYGLAFYAISAGSYHTCAAAFGYAWCWGRNNSGQLGDNSKTDRSTRVQVSGPVVFLTVTAGDTHTCGLSTGGVVYCWGANYAGQLGIGSTKIDSVPRQVSVGFSSVGAGSAHTCGLTSNGAGYCWGYGAEGQLGNGGNQLDSVPVLVSGGHTFTSISVGDWHACAIEAGGTAYCWGFNGQGRLGDGTTTDRNLPVPVAGGLTFSSVVAGEDHTCGITTAGAVYCWGSNSSGQLGNGTVNDSSVPVRVKGG